MLPAIACIVPIQAAGRAAVILAVAFVVPGITAHRFSVIRGVSPAARVVRSALKRSMPFA